VQRAVTVSAGALRSADGAAFAEDLAFGLELARRPVRSDGSIRALEQIDYRARATW
jgi:hypothetical protein